MYLRGDKRGLVLHISKRPADCTARTAQEQKTAYQSGSQLLLNRRQTERNQTCLNCRGAKEETER